MAIVDVGRGLQPLEVPDEWDAPRVRDYVRTAYPFIFPDLQEAHAKEVAARQTPAPDPTTQLRESMNLPVLPPPKERLDALRDEQSPKALAQFQQAQEAELAADYSMPEGLRRILAAGSDIVATPFALLNQYGFATPKPVRDLAGTVAENLSLAGEGLRMSTQPTAESIGDVVKTYREAGPLAAAADAGALAAKFVLDNVPQILPAAGVSKALRGAGMAVKWADRLAPFLATAPQETVQALDEYLKAGADPTTAKAIAPIVGAINGALETIADAPILRRMIDGVDEGIKDAAAKGVRFILGQGFREWGTETGQELTTIGGRVAATGETGGDVLNRLATAGAGGFVGGTVLGGGVEVADRLAPSGRATVPPLLSKKFKVKDSTPVERLTETQINQVLSKEGVEKGVPVVVHQADKPGADVIGYEMAPGTSASALYLPDKEEYHFFVRNPEVVTAGKLREVAREEIVHRWVHKDGQEALATFVQEHPLEPAQVQRLQDAGYLQFPDESDVAYKSRLSDEFISKLNRETWWKRWTGEIVAWAKDKVGLKLTTEQAGRLVLRNLRGLAKARIQQQQTQGRRNAEEVQRQGTQGDGLTVPTGAPASLAGVSRASLVTPDEDAAYLDAVNRGDIEASQRMVDEAAKKAGYTVGPVWHGTPRNKKITEFYPRSHFGTEAQAKVVSAKNLYRVFLRANNPKRVSDQGWKRRWASAIKQAKSEGYDSLVYKNIWEKKGSTFEDSWMVDDPSQIKSAEAVERDSRGNVIPLSQRFNPSSPDIRFSLFREDPAREVVAFQTQYPSAPPIVTDTSIPDAQYDPATNTIRFNPNADRPRERLFVAAIQAGPDLGIFDQRQMRSMFTQLQRVVPTEVQRLTDRLRADTSTDEGKARVLHEYIVRNQDPTLLIPLYRILRGLGLKSDGQLNLALRNYVRGRLETFTPITPVPERKLAVTPEEDQAFLDAMAKGDQAEAERIARETAKRVSGIEELDEPIAYYGNGLTPIPLSVRFQDWAQKQADENIDLVEMRGAFDNLRQARGILELQRYEDRLFQNLSDHIARLADQGKARVLGGAEAIDEEGEPFAFSPTSPKLMDELEAVGVPITERNREEHRRYLAEVDAKRTASMMRRLEELLGRRRFFKQNQALNPEDIAEVIREIDGDIEKLSKALAKKPDTVKDRAGELMLRRKQYVTAHAASRLLNDDRLAGMLDVLDDIDRSGAQPRKDSELRADELEARHVQRAEFIYKLQALRERFAQEKEQFDKSYAQRVTKLKQKIVSSQAREGSAIVAAQELLNALTGEMEVSGSTRAREDAKAIRDMDSAIIKFSERLAKAAPDSVISELRDAIVGMGEYEGQSFQAVAAKLDMRKAASELGIGQEHLTRILDLISRSDEAANAVLTLWEQSSAAEQRAVISQIEAIERAATESEPGFADQLARQFADQQLAKASREAGRARGYAADLQELETERAQREQAAGLIGDLPDPGNVRKMVFDTSSGFRLEPFTKLDGTEQLAVDHLVGDPYTQGFLKELIEWHDQANQVLNSTDPSIDPETKRGLEVALPIVRGFMEANWTEDQYYKALGASKALRWLTKHLRVAETLASYVPGLFGRRLEQAIRRYIEVDQQIRGLLNAKVEERRKLMQRAAGSLGMDLDRKSGDSGRFRHAYDELANRLRQFRSGVGEGDRFFHPTLAGLEVTPQLMTLLRFDRDVFRKAQSIAQRQPYGGVQQKVGGRYIARSPASTGDVGLARLADRRKYTKLNGAYRNAYDPNGSLASEDTPQIREFWETEQAEDNGLLFHVLDSLRSDTIIERERPMREAEKELATDIRHGRMPIPSTISEWIKAIAGKLTGRVADAEAYVSKQFMHELAQYAIIAKDRVAANEREQSSPIRSAGTFIGEADYNEFTSPASKLSFPSSWYNYGASTGFQQALERVADTSQREWISAMIQAKDSLSQTYDRLENKLSQPGVMPDDYKDLHKDILFHTTSSFSGQTITNERAAEAMRLMRERAGVLDDAVKMVRSFSSEQPSIVVRGVRRVYPYLLSWMSPLVSNVAGGPIAAYHTYKAIFGKAPATVWLASGAGSATSVLNSMYEAVGLTLNQTRLANQFPTLKEKLDWLIGQGLISSYAPSEMSKLQAYTTGATERSAATRALDWSQEVADKVSEVAGVRAGDKLLNLYGIRAVVIPTLARLQAIASHWRARLERDGLTWTRGNPTKETSFEEQDLAVGGIKIGDYARIREMLGRFGNPEEILHELTEPGFRVTRFWNSEVGSRIGAKLLEDFNIATKLNRPNRNDLLGLMGWTTHQLNQLALGFRQPIDATRSQKLGSLATNILGASLVGMTSYYAAILARRGLNNGINSLTENLAWALANAGDDDDEPIDSLMDILGKMMGVVRANLPGADFAAKQAASALRAIQTPPGQQLTPLDKAFWQTKEGQPRALLDVAKDLALAAPAGIGIDISDGSYRLPMLSIASQGGQGLAMMGRGAKEIALNPKDPAQVSGGLTDLREGARRLTALLSIWGRAPFAYLFPGTQDDRMTSTRIMAAARAEGASFQPPDQRRFSGWLPTTPVRKELMAAGRRLLEGDESALADIQNTAQFVYNRAYDRALDRGQSEEEANKTAGSAVKSLLVNLDPYRYAVGRSLTQDEYTRLNARLKDDPLVMRDSAVARTVSKAVGLKPPKGMQQFAPTPAMMSPVRSEGLLRVSSSRRRSTGSSLPRLRLPRRRGSGRSAVTGTGRRLPRLRVV